jgi:ABC-type Fe3+ transport system substrate-binding protein
MNRALTLAALALLLVAPLALRPKASQQQQQDVLIIISPHDSYTRLEFGRAFAEWAERERHIGVSIDWRTPGGTNVIRKTISSAVRLGLSDLHPEWKDEQLNAAVDPKLDKPDAKVSEAARAARTAYLASDVGCGIDLWWGGGPQPHRECADAGYSADAGLVHELPDWFNDDVIPATITGDRVYDAGGRWYATCYSAFGIAASADRLALLPDQTQPIQWADLGDPRFFAGLTIVDPTKSGASQSALEMLIQQRMAERVAKDGAGTTSIAHGWEDGFTLIKRIAGNCRGVTDGASVAIREVAHGDAIASMALDFQARVEAAYALEQSRGTPRVRFALPVGGTSISPDPISLLRGAPHRALAVDFIRFVLSREGQRLYSYRIGEPGGPQRWELNRMPIRKDVYTAEDRTHMTAPDLDPYAVAGTFIFHREWTGPGFPLIATMTRAVVLDPREELVEAWRAIIAAGGPERVPEAWSEFTWLPVHHAEVSAAVTRLKDPIAALVETRRWTVEAQRHYREAERLARAAGGAR